MNCLLKYPPDIGDYIIKVRFLATLLLVVIIGNMSIMIVAQKNPADNTGETITTLINIDKVPIDLTGWRETIDGNKNKEALPDTAAFTLFFRFVAGNQDADAKKRIQSYVKQIGLGKCKSCSIEANEERGTEQDLNALINAADEFQRRVSILDSQAVEIKRNNQPSPQVTAQLKQLQLQKESVVIEIVSSLHYKLTETGMNKVIQHINGRVKKNSILKSEQNGARLLNQVNLAEEPSDQLEYTDSYTIEQSEPEPVTDTETGEQTTSFSEDYSPSQVVGVGVTESSYDSDVYMVDTYTTIATPSGTVISQSPVVADYSYARAETIAGLDSETAEEGDYTVQSRHRYKHFSDGVEPVMGYEVTRKPLGKKRAESRQPAPSMCYGCGGYYYTTNFSFRFITVYLQREAFIRDPDPYLNSVCVRAYRGYANYAYGAICRAYPNNRCRTYGIVCAQSPAAAFIAGNTVVYKIWGVRFCPKTHYYWSIYQPPCMNLE